MLSYVDWTIATNVTQVPSAFFFTTKASKKVKSWNLKMKVEL
jgi:hypothetical protein